jgi:FKBP-type peptidyl-prolyl cis-trans isomerase 2
LAQEDSTLIEAGKKVGFEYTLTLEDGSVVQSNEGGEPFLFVHGESQILPALEEQMLGLAVDDEKQVALSAAEAYGELNPDAFQEVALEQIPEAARQVGAELKASGFEGPIKVEEVRDETVLLNFNHPLAGQALTFNIKVLSIE